jgi:hypothetical protein
MASLRPVVRMTIARIESFAVSAIALLGGEAVLNA